MALDIEKITGTVRESYVETGRNFGSDRACAQGTETLKHAKANVESLRKHGYGPSKIALLSEAIEQNRAAGGDREASRTGEGVATKERHLAERAGKGAREQARTVLFNCVGDLRLTGEQTAALEVEQVLGQTASSGSHLPTLSRQLELLAGAFTSPQVDAVVADCGGPEALQAINEAQMKVRAAVARGASHATRTPQETERLDLLDGIIVDLCRQARKAARSAARALGTPALAPLFDLNLLYGRPSRTSGSGSQVA